MKIILEVKNLKNILSKYKSEVILFVLVMILYLLIASIFFTKTTIFYDTHKTYDILLDTDTGVLFKYNIFALAQDNSKHILFSSIVSLLAYPIYLVSTYLNKTGTNFSSIYGIGLIILQISLSSTSITLLFNFMKALNVRKITLFLITTLITVSFPQLFMSLNIERFIYAQLSLIFFIFLIEKLNNQQSYFIDIAAIPLFGITLTNVYLYFVNLLLEFKLNIKKSLLHLGVFTLASYIVIITTKSYRSFFLVSNIIQSDTRFIKPLSFFVKLKMILFRLLYPTLYFPGYEVSNNKLFQNDSINKLFLLLLLLVIIGAFLGGVRNFREKIPKLCLSVILANIILHGIIGYNLVNANIMTLHFSFAIILLLAYLSKTLTVNQNKILNIFLLIIIITVIISNLFGFLDILKLGITVYPK